MKKLWEGSESHSIHSFQDSPWPRNQRVPHIWWSRDIQKVSLVDNGFREVNRVKERKSSLRWILNREVVDDSIQPFSLWEMSKFVSKKSETQYECRGGLWTDLETEYPWLFDACQNILLQREPQRYDTQTYSINFVPIQGSHGMSSQDTYRLEIHDKKTGKRLELFLKVYWPNGSVNTNGVLESLSQILLEEKWVQTVLVVWWYIDEDVWSYALYAYVPNMMTLRDAIKNWHMSQELWRKILNRVKKNANQSTSKAYHADIQPDNIAVTYSPSTKKISCYVFDTILLNHVEWVSW